MKSHISDRIKKYERVSNHSLMEREPVFIRVDGKAFHTFTKDMDRPFDDRLIEAMVVAGEKTAKDMMGFKLGYHQSDEFTFMLLNTDTLETSAWFDYDLSKLVSITSSMFTMHFNREMGGTDAVFDARAFNVPSDDWPNVFVWRQRDWERNSLQMLCRSFYSQKELHGKGRGQMHEMLHAKSVNWADLEGKLKNGTFITREGRVCDKMSYESLKELIE